MPYYAVVGKDCKQEVENKVGTQPFTPHDLRRTAATFLAKSGTTDDVIDAVLNHAKRGVIKVYNQYRYDREKQMALEAWDRKLKRILKGEDQTNVVPLKRSPTTNAA